MKRRETGGCRARKGGCEPGKPLLTHSAAHLGCEEIDGPFLYAMSGFSTLFLKIEYVLSLF